MKKINKKISEIIRVNHAGELGAQKIYTSQIKFTKDIRLKKNYKRLLLRKKNILIILTIRLLKIELDLRL